MREGDKGASQQHACIGACNNAKVSTHAPKQHIAVEYQWMLAALTPRLSAMTSSSHHQRPHAHNATALWLPQALWLRAQSACRDCSASRAGMRNHHLCSLSACQKHATGKARCLAGSCRVLHDQSAVTSQEMLLRTLVTLR